MGCGCGSGGGTTLTSVNYEVVSADNVVLSVYRTEVEAASAAARTPGATYRAAR